MIIVIFHYLKLTLCVNNQLDMLVSHKDEEKKTYVKYHLINKPIRQNNIDEFVDDLFYIEDFLNQMILLL